ICFTVPSAFAANTVNTTPPNGGNAMSLSASGVPMSSSDYSDRKKQIDGDYTSARSQCDNLADNAKDVCVAQAKAERDKAVAQLDAQHKPSAKATENMRVTAAEADYAVAKARCGSKGGNDKDVCLKQAKAQEVSAKADAKANRSSTEAQADAQSDKRDAQYKVALQKCDGLAGSAKDQCVANAKSTYGQ
ncbi:MAG: hypothetical protein ABSF50_20975, partial [Burkholderiaceae bacterium]